MIQFVGSHRALLELPIWAVAILLYAVLDIPIQVLRDWEEGLPYQVSYCAQFGDAVLVGVVLIAATILQRGGEFPPAWSMSTNYHSLAAIVGVSVGIAWWLIDRPQHWGDIYHHLVDASLLVYLAITLVPVIFSNGTRVEKVTIVCFALLWAALVIFDVKHERMNQRAWLQEVGVKFKR